MISRWWCPLVSFKLLRIQLLLSVPAARVYSPSYSYGILPKWLDLALIISSVSVKLVWTELVRLTLKSVQIRSFTWSKYGKIQTRKSLRAYPLSWKRVIFSGASYSYVEDFISNFPVSMNLIGLSNRSPSRHLPAQSYITRKRKVRRWVSVSNLTMRISI